MSEKAKIIHNIVPIVIIDRNEQHGFILPGSDTEHETLSPCLDKFQFISQEDRNTAVRFLNFIKKSMNKYRCMTSTISYPSNDRYNILMQQLLIKTLEKQQYPDGLTHHSIEVYGTAHFKMCVHLLTSTSSEEVHMITKDLGARTKSKLFDFVEKIRRIQTKICQDSQTTGKSLKNSVDIIFWKNEYKKRAFLLKILKKN